MTNDPDLARGAPSRRAVLGCGLAAVAGWGSPARARSSRSGTGARLDGAGLGLRPDAADDQGAVLQRALAEAARSGRDLHLPPGRYRVAGVALPSSTRLVGVPGLTRLVQAGPGPVLTGKGAARITLAGLTVEGTKGGDGSRPLLAFEDVERFRAGDLVLQDAAGTALRLERCGGAVERVEIARADVGIFSLDAVGLSIRDNLVEHCANNGIQVWRGAKGYDGTQVIGNRIRRIGAARGGSGENGNGVNVFRAGGVLVSGNTIRHCAFSAVRDNAGDNVQILGNSCSDLGEVALFAEFGFEGCVIANNLVDRASVGLSITNFNEGGRLAVASGNVVRNLFRRPDAVTGVIGQGIGIAVEADAAVTGNVVEAAAFAGLAIGFGPYLRDVACTGNVVRQCGVGVAVSVAPGAGAAQIAANLFSGCPGGGVVGYAWDKAVSPDLTRSGAERFPRLSITGNTVR